MVCTPDKISGISFKGVLCFFEVDQAFSLVYNWFLPNYTF